MLVFGESLAQIWKIATTVAVKRRENEVKFQVTFQFQSLKNETFENIVKWHFSKKIKISNTVVKNNNLISSYCFFWENLVLKTLIFCLEANATVRNKRVDSGGQNKLLKQILRRDFFQSCKSLIFDKLNSSACEDFREKTQISAISHTHWVFNR